MSVFKDLASKVRSEASIQKTQSVLTSLSTGLGRYTRFTVAHTKALYSIAQVAHAVVTSISTSKPCQEALMKIGSLSCTFAGEILDTLSIIEEEVKKDEVNKAAFESLDKIEEEYLKECEILNKD